MTSYTSSTQTTSDLHDFVDNVVVPMHSVDGGGIILWANRAELDLLGYARDEYVGRHIAQFHADRAVIDDILSRLSRDETLRDYPARLRHRDGSLRDVVISSSVLWRDDAFVHTRCVTVDVTARTRADEERRRIERSLAIQYAVTHVLAEAETLEAATPRILKAVAESGRWMVGALWRVDEPAGVLRCVDTWHDAPGRSAEFESITRQVTFARGTGLPGRVWQSAQPAWIRDVVADTNFPRAAYALRAGLHAAFGFPLRVRDRVTGVLEFFSPEPREPDADLLRLFDALGAQIGQFIERRRDDEARTRLAAIVDSSDDAIVSKTLDGRITSWNRGAEAIFGYTAGEAVGRHISLIIPRERRAEEDDVVARLRRSEKIEHFETERVARDGRRISVSLSVSPLVDAQGTVVGASKVARDITERKRAAAALAESERRFRLLADTAPVLMWVNGAGGCEFVNRAYLEFFGLGEHDVVGFGWARCVHPADLEGYLTAYREAFDARRPFEAAMRGRRADGEYRWLQSFGAPRIAATGELLGYVGVSVDVTDMRRTQEELAAAVRAREDFLSIAGHELRNPLNALKLQLVGLVRAARERGDLLPRDWVCHRLDQAVDDAERLVRLVHNLLDVSRITAGRLDLDFEEVDLARLVGTVVSRFSLETRDQRLALDLQPVTGRWDRLCLDQIVSNLVSNAIKYGLGRPIDIALRVDGDRAALVVRDRGIGIDPANRDRVFSRFERIVSRRQYGGFGLGLWITRQLVEAMGGSIAVDGTLGEGSTFTVTLPLAPPPPVAPEAARGASA